MNILDIIDEKTSKQELTYDELKYIIDNYLNGNIKDYQMSALLMDIKLNGMDEEEIFDLTKIMINSGEILDLSKVFGIKVDKHSTGGVGDKTTLIIGPLVATCGVIVPKLSGRGLGHTGGTIDKLESIPSFNVNLTKEEFISQLNKIGVAISTTSLNLVPADKKIYALRDVTGTVSSIPLIATSIMSKKIATNADKIVLDVKVGSGALLKNKEDAKNLAKVMVSIGKKFNKETIAIISNMDHPLGNNIGNALEVLEAIDILKGSGNLELRNLCIEIASYMVSLGKNISIEDAKKEVINNLDNGQALQKFRELVSFQHGNINNIKVSDKIINIYSKEEGYINNIDALKIGELCKDLGAGRMTKEDIIDYGVGIILCKQVGDYIKVGDTIAKVYMGNKDIKEEDILESFTISKEPPIKEPLIYEIIK